MQLLWKQCFACPGWRVNAARGRMPTLPIFDDREETWRGLEEGEDPGNGEPRAAGEG